MSSVPKSKRKETDFLAITNFKKLRKSVTNLILNDFGYRSDKTDEKIQKYYEINKDNIKVDEICERLRKKEESFSNWYIDEEAKAVLDILRNIEKEFTIGNSIYPSETPAKLIEFLLRRWHINKAIGLCYVLKQEINYVIDTLPVDKNKYELFDESINFQINLYKGIRQSDNRFLKNKNKNKTNIFLEDEITKLFESIINIIRKVFNINKTNE